MDAAGPKPVGPLTLIEGADGVMETWGALNLGARLGAGESLTEIVGTLGVTEIEGTLNLLPRAGAGDSLMEMVGTSGIMEIVGTLTLPLLGVGVSFIEILGMGCVTPIVGTFTRELRPTGPLTEIDGVSDTEIVGIEGPGDVLERRDEALYTLRAGVDGAVV